MKNQSKIQLSSFEMELVTNTSWILTKTAILQKAKALLEEIMEQQLDYFVSSSSSFDKLVMQGLPKISKGENYLGLPYLILDYPRAFTPNNIFAIRTMFWWGNFFSVTLHLSGSYKISAEEKVIASYQSLKENDFFICVHDEQWEHHFEETNYRPIQHWSATDFAVFVREKSFIKLANKMPLQQWDEASEILFRYYRLMMEGLKN